MMPPKGKIRRTPPPDILSNLPESVIDEILLCLPFKDAVRTSILSKKWRYNWCKLPVLTLDEPVWKSKKGVTFRPSKITQIISHTLILHTGPIIKFILCAASWTSCPNIDDLIYFLSRNDIQHLVLSLPSMDNRYKLHSSLFTCFLLRHLTLENCLILLPPDFRGFDRLISLKLRDVTISPELLESLISGCLLLEQLVLHISSISYKIIEINALLLRSFDFIGSIRSICFKSVPRLAKLSLLRRGYSGVPGDTSIAKFFESFSSLEHLHLDEDSVEFFVGAGEVVPKRLPFDLNCVKRLYVSNIWLDNLKVISFALCLIRSFSCLQYMEIELEDVDDDIPALECLEVDAFSDVTFDHLKEVKLIATLGSKPEMQLIKLLLAKSLVLVRIFIKASSWLVKESAATIKLLTELTKFQRASPKVEVDYIHC